MKVGRSPANLHQRGFHDEEQRWLPSHWAFKRTRTAENLTSVCLRRTHKAQTDLNAAGISQGCRDPNTQILHSENVHSCPHGCFWSNQSSFNWICALLDACSALCPPPHSSRWGSAETMTEKLARSEPVEVVERMKQRRDGAGSVIRKKRSGYCFSQM